MGEKVIISSHYLQRTPKNLEFFKKSLRPRADIVKIAAKANSLDDVMTMLSLLIAITNII